MSKPTSLSSCDRIQGVRVVVKLGAELLFSAERLNDMGRHLCQN